MPSFRLGSLNKNRSFRRPKTNSAIDPPDYPSNSCFTRSAYQIVETEAHLKQAEIRLGFYKVICLAVKFHGHAFGAQTSVMQNLTYFEHLSEPMAEMLTILEKEFDHVQLTEEVLREIAGKQFVAQDAKGPRSFSRFLVKLAELSPRVVQKQMSLLMTHLDSEVNLNDHVVLNSF